MVKIEAILEGFRKPEMIGEHVWEAWYSLGVKLGGPMSSRIRPVFTPIKIVGTAITVKMRPGYVQNGWLKAQEIAGPGNVIVIDEEGDEMHSAWGGVVSYCAKKKGIEGVVIDGATRDVSEIVELKFPVFAKAVCLGYYPEPWEGTDQLNVPITCGGVTVRPGDIVVGTDGGVMVVPVEHAEEILKKAELLVKFDAKEKRYFDMGYSIRRIIAEELGGDARKKYEWAAKL